MSFFSRKPKVSVVGNTVNPNPSAPQVTATIKIESKGSVNVSQGANANVASIGRLTTGNAFVASNVVVAGNVVATGPLGDVTADIAEQNATGFFFGNGVNLTSLNVTHAAVQTGTSDLPSIADPGFDVVLLMGQSNMAAQGYYPYSGFEATYLWYAETSTTWGGYHIWQLSQEATVATGGLNRVIPVKSQMLQNPKPATSSDSIGLNFAKMYERHALAPGREILLVPCAWGATGMTGGAQSTTRAGETVLTNWNADDAKVQLNLLSLAVKRLKIAMAYDPINNYAPTENDQPSPRNKVAAVLWHQGEADINLSSYKSNLQKLVDYVRGEVPVAQNAPFMVGNPNSVMKSNRYEQDGAGGVLPRVGNAAYFARTNCVFVDSVGLDEGGNGDLHFSSRGYRDYGNRYFAVYANMPLVCGVNLSFTTNTLTLQYTPICANAVTIEYKTTTDTTWASSGRIPAVPPNEILGTCTYTVTNVDTTQHAYQCKVTPYQGMPDTAARGSTVYTPTITSVTVTMGQSTATFSWTGIFVHRVALIARPNPANAGTSIFNWVVTTDGSFQYEVTGLTPSTNYTFTLTPYHDNNGFATTSATVVSGSTTA